VLIFSLSGPRCAARRSVILESSGVLRGNNITFNPKGLDMGYKTAKESAKEIREALKEKHGWTSRDISVRKRSGTSSSVRVKIKDPSIDLEPVKKIAEGEQSISRNGRGEILGGGNRFVFVEYHRSVEKNAHALRAEEIPKGGPRDGRDCRYCGDPATHYYESSTFCEDCLEEYEPEGNDGTSE